MKPVGLVNPNTGSEDYAVVQLRRDNAEGTLYNLWASRRTSPLGSSGGCSP